MTENCFQKCITQKSIKEKFLFVYFQHSHMQSNQLCVGNIEGRVLIHCTCLFTTIAHTNIENVSLESIDGGCAF